MNKIFIFFVGCFLISCSTFCQTLQGILVDLENQPIEFAEVIVFDNSNLPIQSDLSNEKGEFFISFNSATTVKIQIKQIGKILFEKELSLSKDSTTDLGLIKVDVSNTLSEIVVVAKKKLIEKKADRLIYNVQSSVFANGVSGDELLKNIPRIDPTSDGFKIIGKSNVLIMVDDRLLTISGEELKNYLKTLRSENIEKIEIITSPSAKYDASGNSGLINIKLKQKNKLGFDGTNTTRFTQRTKASIDNSLNLNYSNNKLIIEYGGFYGSENRISRYNNYYFFNTETRNSNESTARNNKGLSHAVNIDYKINKSINLGINSNLSDWSNYSNRFSEVRFKSDNSIYKSQNLPANTQSDYTSLSISPYLDIKLDTLDSKIKFYYNYNKNNRTSNSNFKSENFSGEFEILENTTQSRYNIDNNFTINAFGVDFEKYLDEIKLEFGTKYTNFKNNNNIKFYNRNNGNDVLNNDISNLFRYNEKLFATYINFSNQINEKIFATVGIRYEYTDIIGVLVTQNTENKNFYGNLFPNLSISYEPNETNSYSLSYNKRISRPSLYDLNPFRIYSDANNYSVGNPNLLPNLTDNIELGYVYKGNLAVSLYGSKISDNLAYIISPLENNNSIVTQPKNALTTYDLGSEIGYNWKISNYINNYSSFNISYQKSKSSDGNLNDNDLQGIRSTTSSNTTFLLNESKTNKLFINMFYNTPGVEELYVSKNTFIFRIGAALEFFAKKLNVNAYLTDPFNTSIARNTVSYESFKFQNRIFNDNRSFNISVTYKFGNNKSKSKESQIDNSEKDRVIKE